MEYGYRAFIPDEQKMLFVQMIWFDFDNTIGQIYGERRTYFENFELMPFTGLYDKNREEIFVSDFLKIPIDEQDYDIAVIVLNEKLCRLSLQIVWNSQSGKQEWFMELDELLRLDECEVVGNIYEHPEFFNGGSKE